MNLRDLFERSERNYALSTVRATLNTYQYWLRKGYPEKHAMDNALKYALGQLHSIITPDNLGESLRNFALMSSISGAIALVLERELKKKAVVQLRVVKPAK